ncbi:LacI family DNA-binding transcriptional regulator [Nocardioides panaciterrulae]|uniref:LacI family transcriptional regulator n=1 Tax=Nocardioides panaciterrulae TaxID=661492 RepID=A0A7Y9J9E6_9ACTN|nr:LacI family DNA-binding transcriptional regulator [Nocardioides panaciterrulae]NYD40253.1 LacI family transcriptional regulator [Nocardioides panaciterrulae]
MATLKAVAAHAGVSIATASRALSGHPRVDPHTRERVQQAAVAVGYRPNATARALKSNRSSLVGLVLPNVDSHFYAGISTRIQKTLGEEGYQVIMCLHGEDPAVEREHLLRLQSLPVAAIVHAPTSGRSAQEVYAEAGVEGPYVVEVNRHSADERTDAVCCNDFEGIHQLAGTLLGHGHTRIAMITAQPRESTATERLAGLRAAFEDAGVRFDADLVYAKEYSEAWGRDALRQIMALPEPPSAVIVPANVLVLGALEAVADLRLSIPEDLSLVTFTDFPWHRLYNPPLTSFERPHDAMAYEVCRLLVRHLNEAGQAPPDHPTVVRVPGQLKIRASIKTLASTATPTSKNPQEPVA